MFTKALLSAALAGVSVATADLTFTSQGHMKMKKPSFTNVGSFEGEEDFFVVASFGPLTSGSISIVPEIKSAVIAGDASILKSTKLDTGKFEWPNNVEVVPEDVFGERAIVVPDGFLLPGKKNGGVYIVRMDSEELTKVTETKKITAFKYHYFYHMGFWVDLNGDGRKDFITARSNAKKGQGELLWLEHPEEGLDATEPWTEHVLGGMADVTFEIDTMEQYPDEIVLFAAQFFDEAVSVHRISTKDGSIVQSKVIDDTNVMAAYQAKLVDLNNDGTKQLLVSNHQTKDADTGIWAYEFPKDMFEDDWTRQTIASGFHNAFSMTAPGMSPGFSYAVFPNGQQDGERAHIFVAGDGDHDAHALYPTGDADKFEYENEIFMEGKGTIGCMVFTDYDNDSWTEVWVPNYDKGTIDLFKLSAAEPAAEVFLQ